MLFRSHVVMMPYFNGAREAACFVDMVGGRASVVLLLETAAAVASLGEIVAVKGVTEIVVGLNDLRISLGLSNLFEVVVSDRMNTISALVRDAGIRFGFGGLARVDDTTLPVAPDLTYAQYPRLGATSAWLSRSFYRGIGLGEIGTAVHSLRQRLSYWDNQPLSAWAGKRDELALALQRLGGNRL